MEFVSTAPGFLQNAYSNGTLRNGRVMLGRLLSDARMRAVWPHLKAPPGRPAEEHWLRFWGAIGHAKSKVDRSRRRVQRGDLRDRYAKIANQATRLATKIAHGPLDVLVFNGFPDDVLAAIGVPDLRSLPPMEQARAAHALLPSWPSFPEILRGLAQIAEEQSQLEMTRTRPDQRSTGAVEARTFAAALASEFRSPRMFASAHAGSVATITNVALGLDLGVGKDLVKGVLRRCR